MVKINDGLKLKVNMVDVNQNAERDEVERRIQKEEDQMKVVYPKAGKSLLDFLVCCHKNNSEAHMFPRCSAIHDQKVS